MRALSSYSAQQKICSGGGRNMLEIGTICAEAGEKKTGWLEIEGGGQKLPLTLICGAKEGPTMMISAGIHGAEYIGVQALSELSRELDPKEISGNVICLHVANPSAFRDYVRFFVPEDGKNLNRVFPGKKDGTLSERIAWTITEELQAKADFYIDLHAGDTSEEVMPFVYYNVAAGEKIAGISENMAMAADMKVRASSTATTGAYSSACQRSLPAILMERGGGGRFTDSEVQAYKRDMKNIMIRMGLLSGEEVHTVQQKNVTRAEYLEAETDGLWYPVFSAGDTFAGGEVLGTVRDIWGNLLREYRADYPGIVLYQTVGLGVKAGDPLIAYGEYVDR